MTNTELLKDYIKRSGLKVSYIADGLKLSRAGLYNKINGKSLFNQYEIEMLCNMLGINELKEKENIFFKINVDIYDNTKKSL